jgi:hypothetical protein
MLTTFLTPEPVAASVLQLVSKVALDTTAPALLRKTARPRRAAVTTTPPPTGE